MKIQTNQNTLLLFLTAILLSSSFIFSGCKKGKNSKTNTSTYYFTATIGGAAYSQTVTETNGYEAGSALGGTDDVTISATISPSNSQYSANSTYMDITKGILHNYLSLTKPQFFDYFTPGSFNYTTGPDYDPFKNGDGFIVTWIDGNGTEWNTSSGTGDQTGSTIKIISEQDAQSPIGYYLMVKLQFSCKLYNSNTGEMKQLSNGEFVGLFGKI
jgi:hypothetical protein